MHGWIIYSKTVLTNPFNNNAFEQMLAAAARHGLRVQIVFGEDLLIGVDEAGGGVYFHQGEPIARPHFALLRCYCFELAAALEHDGVRLINTPASLALARNKWLTYLTLARHNVPQPATFFARKAEASFAAIAQLLPVPFVAKSLHGSKGEEVYLIDNELAFYQILTACPDELLFQQYIEESAGTDVRVHVIGGRAVVAVQRNAAEGFRSNFSLGGTATAYPLSPVLASTAKRAANALGLAIAGVDLLFHEGAFLVCEVNGIAAFRTVAQVTDVSIPEKIFEYVNASFFAKRA
jgi:gamma-F420-2:alpha-L-glutamate ligase